MEKTTVPLSGYLVRLVELVIVAICIMLFVNHLFLWGIISVFIFILILPGFLIVEPNKATVLLLFGAYKGTV